MTRIILTQDRLKEVLHYNPLTGVFTWTIQRGKKPLIGKEAGCINSQGYVTIGIDGKSYTAHRLAWLYTHGVFPECDLDHDDRVRHHNWIDNLNDAPRASNHGNALNRTVPTNNTSGIVGVYWYARNKKWSAKLAGKHLGLFDSKDEAITARKTAEQNKGYHPQHGVVLPNEFNH